MVTLKLTGGQALDVSGGHVVLPRTGIWMADLRVNTVEDLPDRVTLDMGAAEMPAAVHKAELVGGATEVRLVGGAGGLGDDARPKHYHRPLVRHVVADLLRDAGETASITSSPDILGHELEAWDTIAMPTGSMLSALCAVVGKGANWRVLTDGTVWIGVEAWPDSGVDSRQINADGPNAAAVLGTDIPSLLPGALLGGRRVDTVQHDLDADRTSVLFAASDAEDVDRAASAWAGMQDAQDPMGLYASMFRAKVLAQNDDEDLVDVRPEDPRLPDMMKIPLRHGIPGLRVKVQLGSYLLIGWDDGRPHQPFAALWTKGTVVERVSVVAGSISLGKRGATEAFVLGTSYRAAEDALFAGLQAAFQTLAPACSPVGPLGPLGPGVAQAIAALAAFRAQAVAAGGYLSPKVKGE
jgi:hypothetical protein